MSPNAPHPKPEPGLFTPEEVELKEATRALRERSDRLVEQSQIANRPPGTRHRFPPPPPDEPQSRGGAPEARGSD